MASYVSGVCSQCVRPFVSVGIESACSVTLKEGGPFVTPVVTTDRYFLGAASARKRSVRHGIGSDLTAVHRFVGLLTSLNSHLATHLIPTASCTFKLAAHQCSPHRVAPATCSCFLNDIGRICSRHPRRPSTLCSLLYPTNSVLNLAIYCFRYPRPAVAKGK